MDDDPLLEEVEVNLMNLGKAAIYFILMILLLVFGVLFIYHVMGGILIWFIEGM